MIKTLLRFALLLALCCLFVYAPEILSSVSAPYSQPAQQRILLRAAICCSDDLTTSINKAITAYQKDHPRIHLRISHICADFLNNMSAPYPDVLLYNDLPSDRLPVGFLSISSDDAFLLSCAVSDNSLYPKAAAEFAAYVQETFSPEKSDPQF